jgi:transglutaminase 1
LIGKWFGDYSKGVEPWRWGGSVEIMQKFFKDKESVMFGQCWVFAGCFATAARALGIPTRVVTNFSSAHDTHTSLTIDEFIDENGKKIDDRELNSDSVWNYHV